MSCADGPIAVSTVRAANRHATDGQVLSEVALPLDHDTNARKFESNPFRKRLARTIQQSVDLTLCEADR